MQLRASIVVSLFSICLLSLLLHLAHAQDAPEPLKPPSFPTLFKTPTGINGYEDWVQAGDLIQNNKLLDAIREDDVTLTFKRHALNDPQIQQALALLRQGLNKSVQMSRRNLDAGRPYPELGALRDLARLLALEIHVRCADGNVEGACRLAG